MTPRTWVGWLNEGALDRVRDRLIDVGVLARGSSRRLGLGKARYRIDERELAPGASAYTVDTLRGLRAELGGDAELYFLMGADQLEKFGTWREPETVRKLARLAVFARPGFEVKEKGVKIVQMQPKPIAASDIRARIRQRKPWRSLVPPRVANYIARHRLYS